MEMPDYLENLKRMDDPRVLRGREDEVNVSTG